MEKKKYRIVEDFFSAKIIELNMLDGAEEEILKWNNFIEMTDEELADKIAELQKRGLEVEKYHQEYKWRKLRNVRDY